MSDVAKHVIEVSASRSDGLSTQRYAHGLRSGLRRKEPKNDCIFQVKKSRKNEVRGKGLLFWLPVLYHEGRSLKDKSFPSGIETSCKASGCGEVCASKRQKLPVQGSNLIHL